MPPSILGQLSDASQSCLCDATTHTGVYTGFFSGERKTQVTWLIDNDSECGMCSGDSLSNISTLSPIQSIWCFHRQGSYRETQKGEGPPPPPPLCTYLHRCESHAPHDDASIRWFHISIQTPDFPQILRGKFAEYVERKCCQLKEVKVLSQS